MGFQVISVSASWVGTQRLMMKMRHGTMMMIGLFSEWSSLVFVVFAASKSVQLLSKCHHQDGVPL